MDIFDNEFSFIAEVVLIHLPLVFLDVVGEICAPACFLEADTHEANAGKELGNGHVLLAHYFLVAVFTFWTLIGFPALMPAIIHGILRSRNGKIDGRKRLGSS